MGSKGQRLDPERRNRESRAIPAPDANAELVMSMQVLRDVMLPIHLVLMPLSTVKMFGAFLLFDNSFGMIVFMTLNYCNYY